MLGGTLTRGPSRPRPTPGRAVPGPRRDRRGRPARAPGRGLGHELGQRASTRRGRPPRRGRRATATRSTDCGVANSASNSGRSCWGRYAEDPAAVVVDDDEGDRRRATRRRADRWCRAGSRDRRRARRPGPACAPAIPHDGRDEAVDAVRTPVGEHAEPGPRRHAPFERAHGQARRDDAARRRRGSRPRHRGRCVPRTQRRRRATASSARRARRSASDHSREPRCRGRRCRRSSAVNAREQRTGVGAHALARGVVRVEPGVVGIDEHGGNVGEPGVGDLARERRADADDEIGPVRGGERVDAQQRLVGRDRVRRRCAAARADRRGSASRWPPRSASATAGSTSAPQPATTQPAWMRGARARRARATSADVGIRGAVVECGSTARRRRGPAASTSGAPVGTSGSRNGRLRCTGPAGGPDVRDRAAASARQRAFASAPRPRLRADRDRGTSAPRRRRAGPGRWSGPRPSRAARAGDRPCRRAAARARDAPRRPRGAG